MNNSGTTSRNNRYNYSNKPPVLRKQAALRSPSNSRILSSTGRANDVGNNYFGSSYGASNGGSFQNGGMGQARLTGTLSRKTGSCQNLNIPTNNNPPSTLFSGVGSSIGQTRRSKPDNSGNNVLVYNPKSNGSQPNSRAPNSTATNNSYSLNSHVAPSGTRCNFYNGYHDSSYSRNILPSRSHATNPTGASQYSKTYMASSSPSQTRYNIGFTAPNNNVHTSSSGSSSDSPDANVHSLPTTTATTTTTTGTSTSYNSRSSERSSPPGPEVGSVERRQQHQQLAINGGASPLNNNYTRVPELAPTKSLNNSVNSARGLVGLANLGNTCFMNSVLQCLSNCQPLQEYCSSLRYSEEINANSKTKGNLIKAYAELIMSMWKSENDSSYISPDRFKRQFQKIAPTFHGSAQQDSQEFLRIMLEGLHQDVNRVRDRPKPLKISEEEDEKLCDRKLAETYWRRYMRVDDSFIMDLFVGQLKSTLLCRHCGYKSITFDPFWDLSLPIPKSRPPNTLHDCLELFTSEEVLDGDEMPKCSRCKQKRPCIKSFSIQKFPKMLVIHLKRFSGDRFRSKISAPINFPTIKLDLSRFAADTCQQQQVSYNLYGVSNHSGTVHGGHYTAFCCHPYTEIWHEYNDTRVHKVASSDVCSSEAYVLFYQLTPSTV